MHWGIPEEKLPEKLETAKVYCEQAVMIKKRFARLEHGIKLSMVFVFLAASMHA